MLEPITVSTSMMIADGRRGALLALVTVLLQLQPTFQWSSAMSTLSDRLLFQYRTDPLAQVDSYGGLSEHEKAELFGTDDGTTLASKVAKLEKFESITFVDIKLIGFDGEGQRGVNIAEKDLMRYFEDLNKDAFVHAINVKEGRSHKLPIQNKYLYQLVKAKASLAKKVQKIVAGYVERHQGSGHVEVPVEEIDKLIEADFKETSLSTTVYILNPKVPVTVKGHEIPYHYVKKGHHCGTSLWAGQERYMWVDISSTTQQYGPSTMGPGVVTPYSIPRLAHYTKRNAVLIHELASHLVTLVRRTCQQLVTPSMQHFPVPYRPKTVVRLIRIKDGLSRTPAPPRTSGFNFDVVKAQLARLQLVGQGISFKETETNFILCPVCATAFHASRKVHTSTIDGGGATVANAYLSSESLHEWLGRVRDSIPLDEDAEDEESQGGPEAGVQEIPIYLFELSPAHAMQIDRNKQAVGFSDMVVAVQSPGAGQMRLDQSCGGTPLEYASDDATRPILAAVLQGGWGVAATHEAWDQASNKTQIEWLWSVGPTVFGYFSDETTLPFAIRDAAKRNVLYSVVNDSIAAVHTFIRDFARYGKELDEVLSAAQHTEFLRRWNVYEYKMDKAGLYISLHNHEHAMYYLLSVKHDIAALRNIVRVAGQGLHSSVVCNKIYTNVNGGSSARWLVLFVMCALCLWGLIGHAGPRGVTLMRERVKRG